MKPLQEKCENCEDGEALAFCTECGRNQPEEDAGWEQSFLIEWNDVTGGEALPDFIFPFIRTQLESSHSHLLDTLVEKIQRAPTHPAGYKQERMIKPSDVLSIINNLRKGV